MRTQEEDDYAEVDYLVGLERGLDGNGWTLRLTRATGGRGWCAQISVSGKVFSTSEAHTRGHAILLALCSAMAHVVECP